MYIFVASPSRIGSKTIKGPVTGKQYIIKPQGTWIDELDKKLLEIEIPYYCFRAKTMLTTKIFRVSPSERQMKNIPA